MIYETSKVLNTDISEMGLFKHLENVKTLVNLEKSWFIKDLK